MHVDELRKKAWADLGVSKELFQCIDVNNDEYQFFYASNIFDFNPRFYQSYMSLLLDYPKLPSDKRKQLFFKDEECNELYSIDELKEKISEFKKGN